MVLNFTNGVVRVDQVAGDGTTRILATVPPHVSGVLAITRVSDERCQDGFGLVALDAVGSEVARLDHWCRYDTWILLEPGATVPPR